MQQAEFEAELKSAGYTEIESKMLDPRPVNHGHRMTTTSAAWCCRASSLSTTAASP